VTLQELLPELSKLPVGDKVEIIKRLTQEVAQESAVFTPEAEYEIWSPYDSGKAAAQLQKMLDDFKKTQNKG